MPDYDFRCEKCAHRFSVKYKTYALFDSANAFCPQCKSNELSRLISRVAIPKSKRDFRGMSSREMLSVLESGESSQVDEMFNQVVGSQSADSAAASGQRSADEADAN